MNSKNILIYLFLLYIIILYMINIINNNIIPCMHKESHNFHNYCLTL